MNNYYFTFGQVHRDKYGNLLKDFYVRVIAESYGEARQKFYEFSKLELEKPDGWAFQYEEKDMNFSYCYKGELICID